MWFGVKEFKGYFELGIWDIYKVGACLCYWIVFMLWCVTFRLLVWIIDT